jgi:hypothetical protein
VRLLLTLYPPGKVEFQVALQIPEADLKLDAQAFTDRFLLPAAVCLLGQFEEPWPSHADKVLAFLKRGGPTRDLKFYRGPSHS